MHGRRLTPKVVLVATTFTSTAFRTLRGDMAILISNVLYLSFFFDVSTLCPPEIFVKERFAREIEVYSTPTVFLNSIRVNGVASAEQLPSLIHQLNDQSHASGNESAARQNKSPPDTAGMRE